MIKFSNGHKMDFCVASGALAYDGNGWWFEQPWRWMRLLRPSSFTIITKTLTREPREGNLNMCCPWRCIRFIKDGVVNAVGLTNPGFKWWISDVYPKIRESGYKVIVSIAPFNLPEAREMTAIISAFCPDIVGIELNVSCPNTNHDDSLDYIVKMTREVANHSKHPVILKLGFDQPYVQACLSTANNVEAFDLINTVPWKTVFPDEPSPLAKYDLSGGVSGPKIQFFAEKALLKVSTHRVGTKFNTPIISGGGIYSYDDVEARHKYGANAFSFGTVFMKRPWLPNIIAWRWRRNHPESHT